MFPKQFLWGAATSSHQVEGDNANNDWWPWEKEGKAKELSGKATRHYELFDQDFQLAKELGHNAHRFSVEWSRVEPQEGIFDDNAINHYRKVVESLKSKSITPVVTLHHFTNPAWFSGQNGWLNPNAPVYFTRYVEKIIGALGRDVTYWVTINEPLILVFYGYLTGQWPPGKISPSRAWAVIGNLIRAHAAAYRKIHDIYRKNQWETPMVGIAKNLRPFEVCPQTSNVFCTIGAGCRHYFFNLYFLEKIKTAMDFIGINYYEREFVSNDRAHSLGLFGDNCNELHQHAEHVNQMGWASYPEGLFKVLNWLKKYNKPLLITENGTAEKDDEYRRQFIEGHLKQVEKALEAGLPVAGYLYWSLLDNFEWHHGFSPRFGLAEVDYETFERKIRPSAIRLRDIIQGQPLE